MALDTILRGSVTGNGAEVDADLQAMVVTNTDPTKAGSTRAFSENDPGVVTGTASCLSTETSTDYRLRVGIDSVLDNEILNYTVQNTGKHHYAFITMLSTVTGGFFTTNSGSITTISTGVRLRTWRLFPIQAQQGQLYVEVVAAFSNTFVTNSTIDFGLFTDSAANPFAPTDGAYFRATSAGLFGVLNYAGAEVTTAAFVSVFGGGTWVPTINTVYQFLIVMTSREVQFWIDNVLYGTIAVATSQIGPCASSSLPFAVRHAIGGTAAGAAWQLKISRYSVLAGDLDRNQSLGEKMVVAGGSVQVQQGATTGGQLITYALGAAPAAVTLTASTAPATNTLGGLFLLPAAINTGESDYPMFAWLNPAGTTAIQGKVFHCTGVIIGDLLVTTALTGGGMSFTWAIGYGSTAPSLATVETASFVTNTTKIARKMTLGVTQTLVATAAVLTKSDGRSITFPTPLPINPGEYLHAILRCIGVNITAGGIRGSVAFLGYFE